MIGHDFAGLLLCRLHKHHQTCGNYSNKRPGRLFNFDPPRGGRLLEGGVYKRGRLFKISEFLGQLFFNISIIFKRNHDTD